MSECCSAPQGRLLDPGAFGLGSAGAASAVIAFPTSSVLTRADRWGMVRMRFGIGRATYRVEPGLYRVGEPTVASPVLVTGNYKFTFDVVRGELVGIDAWLLVLDTKGINVWCAAGKKTFGTKELCRRVLATRLDEVVSHRTLTLPQLGAPGVSAHEVTAFTGFNVAYGPVRASDLPAYLAAGMVATPEMRRVSFNLRDRAAVTGVELAVVLKPTTLASVAAAVAASGLTREGYTLAALVTRGGTVVAAGALGVLAAALTMLLLPSLPFRSFAAKGALIGAAVGAGIALVAAPHIGWLAAMSAAAACTTVASYAAMNYTGSSAITSPSGVEFEMRRAIPWQVAGTAVAAIGWIASAFVGKVG